MSYRSDARTYLTIIQIVGYVLLLRKLFATNLFDKYRYFGFLILAEAVRLPVMASIPIRSKQYAEAYFITTPVVWVLFVLVLLEFFQLILKNHKGIASFGKKALSFSLASSVLVAASTLLLDLQHTKTESAVLFNFMLLERLVMTSLLVLLLSLIAFAAYFPIPIAPNIRVHASVFAVYFSVRTAIFFIRLLFGVEVVDTINLGLLTLGTACLYAWTILLNPAGEMLPARPAPSPADERLLAQLEAINQSLLRSARK
jgi:hypothetical protein